MDSCLVKAFASYGALSAAERGLLRKLEREPRVLRKRTKLIEQGDASDTLYVMSGGWSFNYVLDRRGQRQILDINLPGDIINMREMAFQRSVSGVQMATDGVVCGFPRAQLSHLFSESPRLTGMFFLIAMRREAMLMERVVNLGRRDAFARLCHYFYETHRRLTVVEPALEDSAGPQSLVQPLTQAELGDALGLSEVHVNRILARMRAKDLLEFKRAQVTILDLHGLRDAAEFNESYLDVDRGWIEQGDAPLAVS